MSEFEEDENWSMNNISFRAKRSTANLIGMEMSRRPEMRRRKTLSWVIESFVVNEPGSGLTHLQTLCEELVDLDVKLEQIAMQIIAKHGGEA